jgi:hypothetical protein
MGSTSPVRCLAAWGTAICRQEIEGGQGMIESISVIFSSLSSAASTAKVFTELLRGKRGNTRALLEELKENLGLCWLVIERDTDPMKIIPELATSEYDRLLRTDFDFNSLKRKKIQGSQELAESDLSSFIGKETQELVENIYDKIKALKRIHRVAKDNSRILWRRRIINVNKRILLLMQHLRS